MMKDFRIAEYKTYGDNAFTWMPSNIESRYPEFFDTKEHAKKFIDRQNEINTYSWGRMTTYRVEEI